jgi:Na+-transporting methylmalonyl-CoA/oxaloacetate decarboxylase gamma subunit
MSASPTSNIALNIFSPFLLVATFAIILVFLLMKKPDTCDSTYPIKEEFHFMLNIGVHVTILFLIISLFFVIYVSDVERNVLNSEFESNIQSNLDQTLKKLDPEVQEKLANVINATPTEALYKYYCTPDQTTFVHNVWLFRTILLLNIFFIFIVVCLYLSARHFGKCVNMKEILIENGFIFAGVGVIEFLFFYYVALKYVPAPPSTLVNSIITSIQNVF